jgi:hypothetical protein
MDINRPEDEQDLKALELRLAAWRPSTGALDRDRMLYDAGRAAVRSESHGRVWVLATAALAVVTIGLGALLVQERSRRTALEIAMAARAMPSPPPPAPPGEIDIPPIESPGPSSYFVLTARLAANPVDASWLDVKIEREPHPATSPPEETSRPVPLRPRDIERALDL